MGDYYEAHGQRFRSRRDNRCIQVWGKVNVPEFASMPKGGMVIDRIEIERLVHALYAARLRGDIDAVCRAFSDDATFQMAGASSINPIGVKSVGIVQFRPLLNLLIKSFKLSDHTLLALIIDGQKAAVHWRAIVRSRITGTTIPTELIDLVEFNNRLITSYVEFFVPRSFRETTANCKLGGLLPN